MARRYDRPELTASFSLDDQFMLGSGILIAPVLSEGAASRDAYLPPSTRWCADQPAGGGLQPAWSMSAEPLFGALLLFGPDAASPDLDSRM